MAYPHPELREADLSLRPWRDDDLGLLERVSADDYVATIEHLPRPWTEDAGRSWIARRHALVEEERGWAFAVVDGGEPVGGIGIVFRHPPGAAEPGVWVVADRRNTGVAERATRLLCSWALIDETGIERIQATVEPWNRASQRVLEKVGFVREGLLRSYASWHGRRRDVFLYSLLRSDLSEAD